MTQAPTLRDASRALKGGDGAQALGIVRRVLGAGTVGADEVERAGRIVRKVAARTPRPDGVPASRRVVLLGEYTTPWIATALAAEAWSVDGVLLDVVEGEFDNVVQSLMAGLADGAEAVVLLPWSRRLLAPGGDPRARIDDEVALWQLAWQAAHAAGARVIQLGLDALGLPPTPLGGGAPGPADPRARVQLANAAIRAALGPGDAFVDLPQVAAQTGRRHFYDPRRDLWTRQPLSEDGVVSLARAIASAWRSSTTGPKKVLVLDCDDTLWGGVVGERGATGVTLGEGGPEGEAFVRFQRYVKTLAARGVVLAVATKNELADALGPFEQHEAMVLQRSDLAAFEAGWGPKVESLERIARQLELGLDSFVFFDDSPFERGHVAMARPEVLVVDVPPDPADYIAALHDTRAFEPLALTAEDAERTKRYAAERERGQTKERFGSMEDYLGSLQLRARIAPVDEHSFARVHQLVGKTNQFNLTTRRHSQERLRALLDTPGAVHRTVVLHDRFGEYGLIAFGLLVPGPAPDTVEVDTLLMSCRAIGRTVEHALVGALLTAAREGGVRTVTATYTPTPKNALVADLWPSMGLAAAHVDMDMDMDVDVNANANATATASGEAPRGFEVALADWAAPKTFVAVE